MPPWIWMPSPDDVPVGVGAVGLRHARGERRLGDVVRHRPGGVVGRPTSSSRPGPACWRTCAGSPGSCRSACRTARAPWRTRRSSRAPSARRRTSRRTSADLAAVDDAIEQRPALARPCRARASRADRDVRRSTTSQSLRVWSIVLSMRDRDARRLGVDQEERDAVRRPSSRGARAGDDEQVGDVRVGHEELGAVEQRSRRPSGFAVERDAVGVPAAATARAAPACALSVPAASFGQVLASSARRCRPRAMREAAEDRPSRRTAPAARPGPSPRAPRPGRRSRARRRRTPPGRMSPIQPSSAIFFHSSSE